MYEPSVPLKMLLWLYERGSWIPLFDTITMLVEGLVFIIENLIKWSSYFFWKKKEIKTEKKAEIEKVQKRISLNARESCFGGIQANGLGSFLNEKKRYIRVLIYETFGEQVWRLSLLVKH